MEQSVAQDLVEDLLALNKPQMVIEMPDGSRVMLRNYYHGEDAKGNTIIVLTVKGR